VEAGPLRMKVPLAEIIAIVTADEAKPGKVARTGVSAAARPGERPGERGGARAGERGGAAAEHSAGARPAGRAGVTLHTSPTRESSEAAEGDEINVIGCTVEEATRRADKFLDNAALAGKPEVRVIHGHGTGALRRGLADFFSTHPLVERIHAEADDRGGAAVTVVELKE
jgi:DNA mismatch repair protein MutS2